MPPTSVMVYGGGECLLEGRGFWHAKQCLSVSNSKLLEKHTQKGERRRRGVEEGVASATCIYMNKFARGKGFVTLLCQKKKKG